MKKRIFLIVSSIICCLVSLSLVVYTIVKATSITSNAPGTDAPVIDTNLPGQEITQTVDVRYDMIVGDVILDDTLLNNKNLLPANLSVTEDNKIVAVDAGNALFVVEYAGTKYNYEINVWTKGTGTSEDPFNIINTEDLLELVATNNDSNVYYAQRMDLDLAGQNWKPLGSFSNTFKSNYNGNGYAIKNMSIVVNAENIDEYLDKSAGFNALYLGFFGFTLAESGNVTIENVNIENALIDTTAIDNVDSIKNFNINQLFVGALAGHMYNTSVVGSNNTVSAVIKSSAGDHTGVDGAVGGLVGCATGSSTIQGYNVSTVINATNASYINADGKVFGATVAGIAGTVRSTTIENCTVTSDILVGNYADTRVAGVVVNLENNSTLKNVTVQNVTVKVEKVLYHAEQCVRIAGAIDYVSASSKALNSHVSNVQVYAIGCGQVSGFVSMNDGLVTDCSVKGSMKGAYVAGFVDTNKGHISYTNEAGIQAVDVEIEAQVWGAGVVNDNYGRILGASDNKTVVNAQIYWYRVAEEYFVRGNSMIAGIATINAGKIENLYVTACMYDVVNAGGAIGWVEGKDAELKNSEIYTTIRTNKQVEGSAIQTYTVGGIVAVLCDNGAIIIDNVVVKTSVNSKALASAVYTLETFGGIVGRCYGTFDAKSLELGVSVYANDTIDVDANNNCAKVRILVGAYADEVLQNSKLEGVQVSTISRKTIADDRANADTQKFNIYGNINVNGNLTSLLNYPTF